MASAAFATLVAFLRQAPFTASIDKLERDLVNADRTTAPEVTTAAGLSEELLKAALVVRRDVGRISDVIHATVIAMALPKILEPGEVIVNRPSLGAGNDNTRPFDVETNRRVAEFKVALWSGGDTMRKRGMTADLVHLALDESGRRPELWVAGEEPLRFLRTSTSPVGSLLMRHQIDNGAPLLDQQDRAKLRNVRAQIGHESDRGQIITAILAEDSGRPVH